MSSSCLCSGLGVGAASFPCRAGTTDHRRWASHRPQIWPVMRVVNLPAAGCSLTPSFRSMVVCCRKPSSAQLGQGGVGCAGGSHPDPASIVGRARSNDPIAVIAVAVGNHRDGTDCGPDLLVLTGEQGGWMLSGGRE